MLWSAIHDTFLEAVDAVPELIEEIDDFTVAALGKWDAAGLSGHLLRAIRTPVRYLALPEPGGGPMAGAAAYYTSYLKWRELDPQTADASIATRGLEELDGVDPRHFPAEFRQSAAAARAALQGIHGERKIDTPFGVTRLQDYLRTRTLEVVVHGIDLARATGTAWHPPDTAVADSLLLLTEVARARNLGDSLLMALTGRAHPDDGALPVLR